MIERAIRFTLLALGILLLASPATQARDSGRAQARSVQLLREALDDLDDVIAQIERMKPSRQQERVLRKAVGARARLAEGLHGIAPLLPRTPGPKFEPEPPKRVAPSPMDSQRLDELLRRIADLSFSKDQLAYLEDAVRGRYFVTDQVRRVMRVFSFDADKVKAAVLMYPAVLDREDFYRAQDELSFESDRARLRDEVRRIDASGLRDPHEAR